MYIYILPVVINVVFMFFPKIILKKNKVKRKNIVEFKYEWIICLFLFAIMALRSDTVGVDTAAYQRAYIKIAQSSSFSEAVRTATFTGPGYILMCWILHFISANPRINIFTNSLLILFLLLSIVKKEKNGLKYIYLWQVTYLFAFSLNGNRQVLATLIQMNAIEKIIDNKKNILGWILILIGFSIHPISIVFVIMYFFSVMLARKTSLKGLMGLAIFFGICANFIMHNLVNLIIYFLPTYSKYINGDVKRGFFNEIGGGKIILFYLFILAITLCIGLIMKKKKENKSDFKWRMVSIIFISTLGILNSRNTTIFRIFMCLLPQALPIFVDIPDCIRIKRKGALMIEMGVFFCLFIYMIFSLMDNQSGVIPYITYF